MMKNLLTIALIAATISLIGQSSDLSKHKAQHLNSEGIIQSSPLAQKQTFKKLCTGVDLGLPDTILKCKNDSLFLFADTGHITYIWSNGSQNYKDTITNDGIYWLSITDTSGCNSVDSVNVIHLDLSVTPKDTSICSSDSIQMNVQLSPNVPSLSCGLSNKRCYGASNDYVLGNGTNNTTLTTPYRGYYRNAKNQYLILASELHSMGISAGALNSIAFNIYDKKSWFAYENFSISIGCTQENELLSWQNGLFKVFDTSYTTILGWNTHHFDQAYNWDGTSNIVIEVCYFTSTQPPVDYDDVYYTITPFSSVISNWNDNIINACDASDSVFYVARPNMQFNICEEPGLFGYTFSWRPSNIITDTTIVNPVCFTNSSADVIVALNSNSCIIEDTAHININPNLNINLGNDTLICNQDTFEIDAGIFQSYLWSDSSTNSTIDVLSSGLYSVTVTDSFNCQGSDSINVTKSQTLNLIKTSSDITCHGDSNGTASVAVSGGANPYIYVWSHGATSSSVSGLTNAYYYVTVSDSNYCSINDSIFIDEPKVFSSTITATNINCYGANTGSASINISGGKSPHTYYWSNGMPDTLIQNLNAGSYYVTITDDNLCIYYDSILITQSDSINIANTLTQPLCHGDSNGSILSTITGGNPTYTYQWNNGANNKDLFNIGAGIYIVTITDQNSCKDSFEINLNEPSILSSQTNKTDNFCNQNNGTISCVGSGGTPPFSYQWSNASQSYLSHGIYHVTITDSNACSRVDSIIVDSIGWPDTDFSYHDICEGQSVTMTGIDNGFNISNWSWNIGSGMFNLAGSQVNQTFYNDTTISVQLIAEDINGCKDTTTHTINIYPVPIVGFSSDTLWGCEELIVQFNDQSIYDSVQSYDWAFEGHGSDTINNPIINFNTIGSWNVSLKVTSINGCESETIKDQHIIIYPNPISSFNFYPTETDILNPEVTFTNTSIDDISWSWDFGDGNSSIEQNPIHTYEDTGHYTMILTVSSINGCIDTSMNNIHIKKGFRIFIPNSFTPNNDGVNDMFGPVGTFGAVDEYNLFIYNRWGEILFEANDPYTQWNGKYQGTDKSVPLGNYVYYIKIIDEYGELFSYTGNIVLARNYFD